MARTPKYSVEQIVQALKDCKGMVYVAAKQVGCDPDTIYERAKSSLAIRRAMKNERGMLVDTTELKFFQAIQNGEAWAIAMCLKTLGKDRGYVERQEYRNLSDDDLNRTIESELARVAAARAAEAAGPPEGGG